MVWYQTGETNADLFSMGPLWTKIALFKLRATLSLHQYVGYRDIFPQWNPEKQCQMIVQRCFMPCNSVSPTWVPTVFHNEDNSVVLLLVLSWGPGADPRPDRSSHKSVLCNKTRCLLYLARPLDWALNMHYVICPNDAYSHQLTPSLSSRIRVI